MCHVAAEMEREGFDVPLLIGGATTSRVHTAVKISPNYMRGQTVHVLDASRAVGVASSLLGGGKAAFVEDVRERISRKVAEAMPAAWPTSGASRSPRRAPTASPSTGAAIAPPRPTFLGTRAFRNYPVAELVPYIDWTPFFATWEIKGTYPLLLDDEKVGEAARALFDDAQAMLKQMVAENWLTANGVIGFWPANADGDDIVVYGDETRTARAGASLHAPPADRADERPAPSCGARRFRRAARDRPRRLRRRLRRHRRHRRGGGRGALRARQ